MIRISSVCRRFNVPRYGGVHSRVMCTTPTPTPIPKVIYSEGLPRWPGIYSSNAVLRGLDWLGTAAFATSGTVSAGFAGLDFGGCVTVGAITAVGGGTVRDLIIGNLPVFWTIEYEYILICIASSIVTFMFWGDIKEIPMFSQKGSLIFWADTVGLGTFCIIGAQNGIRMGLNPLICILCGMFTATFGGIIRDTLVGRPAKSLHKKGQLYASSALSGSAVYVLMRIAGFARPTRILPSLLTAVGMKVAAEKYELHLPQASWCRPEKMLYPPDAEEGDDSSSSKSNTSVPEKK
mmetsp:Transcript_12362/g.18746  ORF Transcript_12362/g.18746 Transcript_12362/m.18746 type:complete len:292 (+) Transcript_12362:87-962(+)